MSSLEDVWAYREEYVYPHCFGPLGKGIFCLDQDLFARRFQQTSVDPRWLNHGVFESPPNDKHRSWLYVTSGMSNPWDVDPADFSQEGYSGLGTELVLEAPEQSAWAIRVLQNMTAYNLLISVGRFGNNPLLDYGHRIPLNSSISDTVESKLRNVVVAKPGHYPMAFVLASGRVDFLHFVGVTDAELAFAKANSTEELIQHLEAKRAYPVTDPYRASTIRG